MQTGNVGDDSGLLNKAEATQYGSTNESTINQWGDENNAISQQGLNNAESKEN